jgi:ubiquinone/menaquinone biosynthesis C-methylase UbiE
MGRKRRSVGLDDPSSWVYNRMAEVYDARPAYPSTLIDALIELAAPIGRRVLDLGAGVGHLALPLVERGLEVVAIEPAQAMLERLQRSAEARSLALSLLHAKAEALPFQADSFDLVLIADALHFLDAELVAAQLRRVLVPRGVLAIVTCEFTETPFMRAVRSLVEESADRRPRDVEQAVRQLAALADVQLTQQRRFQDETPVDPQTLERILRSVSFIGPALNPLRFAALRRRLHALPHAAVWARTFTLRTGLKRRSGSASAGKSGWTSTPTKLSLA